MIAEVPPQPWPVPLDPEAQARRHDAALDVQRARQRFADLGSYDDPERAMLLDDHEVAAGWDADIDRLLAEAIESRSGDQLVELPAQLSTTAVLRLNADPDGFAAELARPMPRQPSRSARFGTRFHHWVEHYFSGRLPSGGLGQQQLLILTTCPTGQILAPTTSRSYAKSVKPSRPDDLAARCRTPSRRRSASGWPVD